jgi:hypothetical protein
VITGPPGQRPEAIFDNVEGPLLVLWGKEDTVTALDGPVCYGSHFWSLSN